MRPWPTAVNIFGVGVEWEFKKSDRGRAQQILDYLADRRVLTVEAQRPLEDAESCLNSAQGAREYLSALLEEVPVTSKDLRTWLYGLRGAFTAFLEAGKNRAFEAHYQAFVASLTELHFLVEGYSNIVAERYKLTRLHLL
ncbi:hypothetical protein [Streptomyces sp. BH055]|uniref:hypothetical protein n=1 Tax=Streptomyces sp. BH055 TaxID=3401173 RepID=UPI003BB60362